MTLPDVMSPSSEMAPPPNADELTPEQLETIRRIGEASRTRIIAILSMPDEWSRRKSIQVYTGGGGAD